MKIIVDYEQWVNGSNRTTTGGNRGLSELINSHGYKCCLGFGSEQAGVPSGSLLGKEFPEQVNNEVRTPLFCQTFLNEYEFNNEFSMKAARINDDAFIGDRKRMEQLKELAIEYGNEFEFINVPVELTN